MHVTLLGITLGSSGETNQVIVVVACIITVELHVLDPVITLAPATTTMFFKRSAFFVIVIVHLFPIVVMILVVATKNTELGL